MDVYTSETQTETPTMTAGVVGAAIALIAVGVVMVASAGATLGGPTLDWPLWRTAFGRHTMFAAAGLVAIGVSYRLGRSILARPRLMNFAVWSVFAFGVASLVAVLIPGLADAKHGAHRWLTIGPASWAISFQPSELAKAAMVAVLAVLLGGSGANPRSLRRCFAPAVAVIGVCVALVGIEDLGTAALMAGVGGLTLFVAGCRPTWVLLTGLIGAGGLAALIVAEDYRVERLTAFMDIWADPRGSGYHPIQSLVAIGSGGWWGVGLGSGLQKYGYLPEARTDFIFSVICEETGFIGGALVIGLFIVLVWTGTRAMRMAVTRVERLLAFGITATIGLQAVMHVAVTTVVAPTTGMSLPFVSAGGSGLITMCAIVGLLAAVSARTVARQETEFVVGAAMATRRESALAGGLG